MTDTQLGGATQASLIKPVGAFQQLFALSVIYKSIHSVYLFILAGERKLRQIISERLHSPEHNGVYLLT